MRHKVNGVFVAVTRIWPEAQYWRWLIRDISGREYLDGGNYLTQEAAEEGLQDAYDSPAIPCVSYITQ